MNEITLKNGVTLTYELKTDAKDTAGNVVVTGYVGEAPAHVTIPATIVGRPVTEIGANAFLNVKGLASVETPETLKVVGSFAFSGCSELESLVLSAHAKLADYPFLHCGRLVVAFRTPSGEVKRVRAETTQTLDNGAGLEFELVNGGYELVGHTGELPTTILVPDAIDGVSVVSVGGDAFTKSETLVHIILPDTVTTIKRSAFRDCRRLESVRFPAGLVEIGAHVFDGCVSLREAQLPPTLKKLGVSAFSGCGALGSSVNLTGLEKVNAETFKDCVRLTGAELSASTGLVGNDAFRGCTALRTLKAPGQETRFMPGALDGCPQAEIDGPFYGICRLDNGFGLLYKREEDGICVTGYAGAVPEEFAVPETIEDRPVVGIADHAFYGCGAVSVTTPKSLRRIGGWAFRQNLKLASIELPDDVESIGPGAFSMCPNLVSAKLPKNLAIIENRLFHDSFRLESVKAPETLTEIGTAAFYGCERLASMTLPGTVARIGGRAFFKCVRLTGLALPENLAGVDPLAFTGCPLPSVSLDVLRDKLNAAGAGKRQYERVGDALVGYELMAEGAVIVGYAGALPARFVLPDTLGGRPVVGIFDHAFSDSSTLVKVVFPPTLARIGLGAFLRCVNLESAAIPASVRTVEPLAFNGCPKLQPQSLPATVTSVGENVFTSPEEWAAETDEEAA